MTWRFTILGCGSSGGVPRIGSGWGACDPNNPKNRRRRCSLLVERLGAAGTTTVLVDTSPDIRDQLLDADVRRLDGVLFTHEHADHTHGIDDLRALAIHQRQRINVYTDKPTSASLQLRFSYCFETPPGSSYPPILREHRIASGRPVTVDGAGGPITALPFLQNHGDIESLGFRFGDLAYSSDVKDLPAASVEALRGLSVWVVDALRYTPHPSHWSLPETLDWIARLEPARSVITNMHVDLDYETLRRQLPAGIEPAFDGMRIVLADNDGAADARSHSAASA
jgi:phosphoribosyl 1,2-cyclic phosphate phosphodiesterase